MNEQIEIYKERVKKLVELLNQQDPNWISTRKWVHSMIDFELGNDFFIEFFIIDEDELTMLQTHVITAWADEVVKQSNPVNVEELLKATNNALSKTCLLGAEIDHEYLSVPREEINYQQKCLDYAWWISIKEMIYPGVSKQYKTRLDKKAEKFLQELKS